MTQAKGDGGGCTVRNAGLTPGRSRQREDVSESITNHLLFQNHSSYNLVNLQNVKCLFIIIIIFK